jgi:hypothetical protein
MMVMKKMVCVLGVLLFFSTLADAQMRNLKSLIGEWEAVDGANQSGGLIVRDSSKLYLVYGTDKREIVNFKADFSKSPCWFDFTIKDSTSSIQLKSLLLFINDNLVQWQVFDGDTRPDHFSSDNGEVIFLKRKLATEAMVKSD